MKLSLSCVVPLEMRDSIKIRSWTGKRTADEKEWSRRCSGSPRFFVNHALRLVSVISWKLLIKNPYLESKTLLLAFSASLPQTPEHIVCILGGIWARKKDEIWNWIKAFRANTSVRLKRSCVLYKLKWASVAFVTLLDDGKSSSVWGLGEEVLRVVRRGQDGLVETHEFWISFGTEKNVTQRSWALIDSEPIDRITSQFDPPIRNGHRTVSPGRCS